MCQNVIPRALADSQETQHFLNISVKRAFASNFFRCFELLQQRLRTCQGHHPCQIIPCGTHSFFLRARTPKSSKTNGFLKNFSTAYHKITRIAPQVLEKHLHEFSKFLPARAVRILQNQWFFNIYDTRARASHFRTLFQRRRAPARGHNPLQIIPCGPHARACIIYNKCMCLKFAPKV